MGGVIYTNVPVVEPLLEFGKGTARYGEVAIINATTASIGPRIILENEVSTTRSPRLSGSRTTG